MRILLAKNWKFLASLALQLAIAPFLAHGYDLRVSVVAGRNVVSGGSPYDGGAAPAGLEHWYGSDVQGIAEAPLWALYLGLAYLASQGNYYLFNLVSKLPIVGANIALAYLAFSMGRDKWSNLFLFNPLILLASVAWGKPDNIAALLAALSLLALHKPTLAGALAGLSLMIKPLGLPVIPVLLGHYLSRGSSVLGRYLLLLTSVSAAIFFAPFVTMAWSLHTLFSGLGGWFIHAGGLTPFNILELTHGSTQLPSWLAPVGLGPLIVLGFTLAYSVAKHPTTDAAVAGYCLAASAIFLASRSWISEQNLIILFALLMLISQEPPSRWLWAIPLAFMVANTSLPQLFYLVYPPAGDIVASFDGSWRNVRLLSKFLISLAWLPCLYICTRRAIATSHAPVSSLRERFRP